MATVATHGAWAEWDETRRFKTSQKPNLPKTLQHRLCFFLKRSRRTDVLANQYDAIPQGADVSVLGMVRNNFWGLSSLRGDVSSWVHSRRQKCIERSWKHWKVIVLMWIWRPHPRQACAQLLWKMIQAELSRIEAMWVVLKLSNGKVPCVAFLAFHWVKEMCAYGSMSRAPMQTNNRQLKKKKTGSVSVMLVWRQLRSDSPILAKISTGLAVVTLYNRTMDTQWIFCRQGVATIQDEPDCSLSYTPGWHHANRLYFHLLPPSNPRMVMRINKMSAGLPSLSVRE